jgi:hypothetical protein
MPKIIRLGFKVQDSVQPLVAEFYPPPEGKQFDQIEDLFRT